MAVFSFVFSVLACLNSVYPNPSPDSVCLESLSSEKFDEISQDPDFIARSSAQITVFTHGLGSFANDWETVDMRNSLPASLPGEVYCFTPQSNSLRITRYDIGADGQSNSQTEGFSIDACAPSSFVFNDPYSDNMSRTTADVYALFDKGLDSILHAYYDELGLIPRVNLVGHSRGGLVNLLYAINHPLLVDNLISVGTPYIGTRYGQALIDLYTFLDVDIGEAYYDLTNPTVYGNYRNQWNQVASQYNIHATAIGWRQSFSSFTQTLSSPYGNNQSVLDSFVEQIANGAGDVIANQVDDLFDAICEGLSSNNILLIRGAEYALSLASGICDAISFFGGTIPTGLVDTLSSLIQILHQDFYLEGGIGIVGSDICVETSSQLGQSPTGDYDFDRITFTFTGSPSLVEPSRSGFPPVLHNLETKNPDVIEAVVDQLTTGPSPIHTHSFLLEHSNNSHYLECSCGSTAHWASHQLTFQSYSPSREVWKCECGFETTKKHSLVYSPFGSSYHQETCSTCDYSDPCVPHGFTYKNFNSSYHIKSCPCGLSENEEHIWIGTNSFCSKCKRRQDSSVGLGQL